MRKNGIANRGCPSDGADVNASATDSDRPAPWAYISVWIVYVTIWTLVGIPRVFAEWRSVEWYFAVQGVALVAILPAFVIWLGWRAGRWRQPRPACLGPVVAVVVLLLSPVLGRLAVGAVRPALVSVRNICSHTGPDDFARLLVMLLVVGSLWTVAYRRGKRVREAHSQSLQTDG